MQVGVVGINHKLADLKLREKLAKSCQKWFGPGILAHLDHNFVLLTTCNRTEIYFSSTDLSETHAYILSILKQNIEGDYEQKLYSFFHRDCFTHLARVTCGLDSAIVFETEIQGQVKIAYENALAANPLPKDLHFLFQKSLRVGKKVRSNIPIERRIPGLDHAIHQTGQHLFKKKPTPSILFVGASDINIKILQFLKSKGLHDITLCNRTEKRARQLAKKFETNVINWENLSLWHHYDWIIFGTKAPEYLITEDSALNEIQKQKLIIDLCVPRNVDPQIGKHPKVTLINIDQVNRMLKHRKKRLDITVKNTENLVERFAFHQVQIFLEKSKTRETVREPSYNMAGV